MSNMATAVVAPAVRPCPHWCDGSHPITDEGIYHSREVGRIDSGPLALIVSVAHWVPADGSASKPAVTLAWEEDGFVNLLEGIELDPAEAVALVPLLTEANTILRREDEQ